jgi:type I restriction enzyme M protein
MATTDGSLFELPRGRKNGQAELAVVVKRARDIMRKDAGINGELDRMPQFTWMLFLKALDAHEYTREHVTAAANFKPLVEAPHRWRDWAGAENPKQRITGEPLLTFINVDLLPYLR